ncbi:major facilitator superfamily domain-containing protein [Panaeolus papilionaceus]|nr:major facilitator superfamily domain-containing protein [Panaeolus papilionaceus]
MAFADKTTLGQSAVLGIIPGTHLTQNQFNWLSTIFYLSYLVFEYPQNFALQRLPVGKWISINIFIWSVALLTHAACTSFGGLFAVRFILGMCEGAITPGFMIVTSMFYTRAEQNKRVGYWFLMNGFAIIFLGFVSFGVLHSKTHEFMPWQWLMIITGILTLITSILFWFFFPDSPTTAYFLTAEERVAAVKRIKSNQAGVENKQWKREQFIEAFCDPKVWIMALFAAVANIVNSLTNQRQLIINQFGFTPIQTTLLGCVDGVMEIITIYIGVTLAAHRSIGRGYASVIMYIPALLGAILVSTLPSHNKIGLLFSYWISIFVFTPFVILLGWIGVTISGHTKKTTANAIVLCGYAIGNAVGPFMWKKQYQPRNHVPWAIIAACIFTCSLLALTLRFLLRRENRRRDLGSEQSDTSSHYDDIYMSQKLADGSVVEKRIDRAFLDITDTQNKDFRYVL